MSAKKRIAFLAGRREGERENKNVENVENVDNLAEGKWRTHEK